MIKAVIFDIDGVLLDSFESNYNFFKEVCVRAGHQPLTKDTFRKAFHLTLADFIKKYLAKGSRAEFNRIYKIAYAAYLEPEEPKLRPGSVEGIKNLAKEFLLGIVTGRMKEGVDEYLNYSKLRGCFKTVVHNGHYRKPKPAPEPILKALRRLRVNPGEAVYVGDTLTDIKAAKAAKVRVILFNKKRFGKPDFWVRNFRELQGLLTTIS